ncbi:MAG: hypothetical protein J7L04_04300 [Bacteroidales bacterium]|nr:hypothetical protein [Bacteroidales bacterium]
MDEFSTLFRSEKLRQKKIKYLNEISLTEGKYLKPLDKLELETPSEVMIKLNKTLRMMMLGRLN